MRNRRAALDGLGRILDAGAPEELFGGSEEEASFLYELLEDAARARGSTYYWEICRTARRRGVTPEYVVDRAAVLLAAITERRRSDLYRILGVPALASSETIRHRWLEVAKRHHPDVGGDAARFRQAKQAYEVLRDPDRRVEYERFWLRALGPFERVAPAAGPALPERAAEVVAVEPVAANGHASAATVDVAPIVPDALTDALGAAARVLAERRALDARVAAVADAGGNGLSGVLARLEAALAPLPADELTRLAGDAAQVIAQLEALRDRLAHLAALKRRLDERAVPAADRGIS